MADKHKMHIHSGGKPFSEGTVFFKTEGGLPPGAVPLTHNEILRVQERKLYSWDNERKYEMYPLRYGFAAIGLATGLCGFAMNMHFRKLVVLEDRFLYRNMILASIIPGYFSAMAHLKLVKQPIQLQPAGCQLCLQLRSAAVTGAFGSILPATLGLFTTTLAADMEGFYKFERAHMPTYAREFVQAMWKGCKSSFNLMIASFCVMFVVGQIVAFYEIESAQKLNAKILGFRQLLW